MITPVALARRCTRIGSAEGGRRAGRADAAQPGHFGRGERVGPGAQQHPGLGIVEHQGGGLDADADQLPAEDLSGEQLVAAQADQRSLERSLRELGWVIEVKLLAGPFFLRLGGRAG